MFTNYIFQWKTLKVCIIRLVHICFEKSSSTFWQVRCCKNRTRCSCQKYDRDFFKFCGLLRKPKLYYQSQNWFQIWYTFSVRPVFVGPSFHKIDFKYNTLFQCAQFLLAHHFTRKRNFLDILKLLPTPRSLSYVRLKYNPCDLL